jgi:hypothetical protein
MGAPKRALPPALAANRWKRGQSGNLSGHSGAYGEAMKLAQAAAPQAICRLMCCQAPGSFADLVGVVPPGPIIP